MPTQNSTLFPNYLDNRNAVSTVIRLFHFSILETRAAENILSILLYNEIYKRQLKNILLKFINKTMSICNTARPKA